MAYQFSYIGTSIYDYLRLSLGLMVHTSVLLKESVAFLDPKEGEYFVDATLGGGGHAMEIAERIGPTGKLLAIDLDEDAREKFQERIHGTEYEQRIVVRKANFAALPEIMRECGFPKADGLIADLGFSSDQLETSMRGFSFRRREPLMMNYDADTQMKAAHIINSYSESDLQLLIRRYSGERYAGRIAHNIVRERRRERIITTDHLVRTILASVPKNYEHGRIHPATRTFMALRIAVNQELDNLIELISNIKSILRPGGRIAVITFHSLEDVIVKDGFRDGAQKEIMEILNKKPIVPSEAEIEANPRARSAKLRAARII